jgi:hypothetical protein
MAEQWLHVLQSERLRQLRSVLLPKNEARSAYEKHMRKADAIWTDLQAELAAAKQIVQEAKPGFFRTPIDAFYYAEFFTTCRHPGSDDNAIAWRIKLNAYLSNADPNGF